MEHILVTGGAGYIGSTLVPMLLEEGYYVTVLDKLVYGVSSLLSASHHRNLNIIKGDILDEDLLVKAMEPANVIIHLAAIVGYPACDAEPELAKRTNLDGTQNIVHNLKKDQKLVFASTGSCYGDLADFCTEEKPINPISLYGRTKAEGEHMVLGAGGVVLRFSTLFGVAPRLRMDLLVNHFTMKAIFDKKLEIYEGHFKRSFVHVRDAAKSFLFAIDKYKLMRGEIYNIGNGDLNMTKMEVATAIAKFSKKCQVTESSELTDLDKRNYAVSFQKVNKLGYHCSISLRDGLAELFQVIPCLSEQELKWFAAA